ncbi:MAG: thioredoxin family protein [candidate division WOR-3 bacterium]
MHIALIVLVIGSLVSGCGTKPKPVVTSRDTLVQNAPESTPVQVPETSQPAPPETQKTLAPAKTAEVTSLPKLWDFWATWCPPCQKEKPIIEELAEEFKGRIEIVSIDVDKNKPLAQRFGVQAIPTLVFLDAEEKELARHVGFWPRDSIVAKFRELGFIK